MRKLFIAGSGAFGAIPGIAIIWSGMGTPPDYARLFGGVIEAIGVLSILILWFNKERIRSIPKETLNRWVIRLTVAFVGFISIYLFLFDFCVVSHPTHGTAYFPLWTEGKLNDLIERAGGRWSALDKYGNYNILSKIEAMPSYVINLTTIVLLLVYQGVFTTITIAFGLLGIATNHGLIGENEPNPDLSKNDQGQIGNEDEN